MKAALPREMQTMRNLLSRFATRFRSDALFRFDVAAAATFCVSVTWSLGLVLTCGSPLHAWRWAGNHLTYGLWQTFIMPIAMGTVFGTLRFEPSAANRRAARRRRSLGIGLILAVVAALTVVDFRNNKVEPYMLKDKSYLTTEVDLRVDYWAGAAAGETTLENYHQAMYNWQGPPSSLSWNAYLNPVLTWVFGSFVVWYVCYSFTVLRTGNSGGQGPTLGRLAFVAGLICLWLPFRHYADWHNSYFWERAANPVLSYLLIVAVVYWSVLGIAAWKQRRRRIVPGARPSISIVLLSVANMIVVLLALPTHVRQILPSPPSLDDLYHAVELRIGIGPGSLWQAPILLTAVIGLFVFAYLAARKQFAPEGEGADEQHDEAGAADDGEAGGAKQVSPEDRETERRAEVLNRLSLAYSTAYVSFRYAKSELGGTPTDREAWSFLRRHKEDLPDCRPPKRKKQRSLKPYRLPPSFRTWTRYLRRAREALGEQKNHPRDGRPHGPSIVDPSVEDPRSVDPRGADERET